MYNHDDRDRYSNQERDQQRDDHAGEHSSPSLATVKPELIPFANQALLGRVPSFPVAPSQFFRCFNHKIRRQMYLDQSSRLIIIIRLLWHHYLYQYRLVVHLPLYPGRNSGRSENPTPVPRRHASPLFSIIIICHRAERRGDRTTGATNSIGCAYCRIICAYMRCTSATRATATLG